MSNKETYTVFFFMVLLLGILALFSMIHTVKELWWAWIFGAMLIFGFWMESFSPLSKAIPRKISGSISQNTSPVYFLDQDKEIMRSQKIDTNTINFDGQYHLKHSDYDRYKFSHDFFMDLRVGMELLEDTDITFIVVADDGYKLKVDNKTVMSDPDSNDISLGTKMIHLGKGRHRIDVSYFQSDDLMTLRIYYRLNDKRFLIGNNYGEKGKIFLCEPK